MRCACGVADQLTSVAVAVVVVVLLCWSSVHWEPVANLMGSAITPILTPTQKKGPKNPNQASRAG